MSILALPLIPACIRGLPNFYSLTFTLYPLLFLEKRKEKKNKTKTPPHTRFDLKSVKPPDRCKFSGLLNPSATRATHFYDQYPNNGLPWYHLLFITGGVSLFSKALLVAGTLSPEVKRQVICLLKCLVGSSSNGARDNLLFLSEIFPSREFLKSSVIMVVNLVQSHSKRSKIAHRGQGVVYSTESL